MTFNLTESLLDEIITALENQEQQFLVDAAQNALFITVFYKKMRYKKQLSLTSED